MGERIQWIASVMFALAFVAILSVMNSNVMQFGNHVNNQVNNKISVAESYEVQTFDETVVTGDTVLSAIKNQDTLYTNKLSITVDGTEYGPTDNTNSISLSKKYKASLQRNANDMIVGVSFTGI